MLTRRQVLTAVGLAVAGLWDPASVAANQKTPKPKLVTVTLTIDGMT